MLNSISPGRQFQAKNSFISDETVPTSRYLVSLPTVGATFHTSDAWKLPKTANLTHLLHKNCQIPLESRHIYQQHTLWPISDSTLFITVVSMVTSSLSSWHEAFSRSLPPLRSFARTVGPPLAAGPQSLLHPCRGRSGGSRWSMVDHRHVSTPVKAAHHPSSWCIFVGSGLLVHRVEVLVFLQLTY